MGETLLIQFDSIIFTDNDDEGSRRDFFRSRVGKTAAQGWQQGQKQMMFERKRSRALKVEPEKTLWCFNKLGRWSIRSPGLWEPTFHRLTIGQSVCPPVPPAFAVCSSPFDRLVTTLVSFFVLVSLSPGKALELPYINMPSLNASILVLKTERAFLL